MAVMQKFVRLSLFVLTFLLGACDLIGTEPTLTPIMVTATQEQRFLIVTATFTPSPSPVLAPTLPGQELTPFRTSTSAATATQAVTQTPTFTPTPTDTPVTPGAIFAPVGGIQASGGVSICSSAPQGGFGTVYTNNPDIAAQIGCPLGSGSATPVNNAYQTYEGGLMVWVSSVGVTGQSGIFAIINDGTFQRFNDTWREGIDPFSVGLSPPSGRIEPIRGFGKVWRETAGMSETMGWATSEEIGGTGFVLSFERGEMIYVPQNGQTYVLVAGVPGVWTSIAQPY
ncbi:MAG: hypothetical protein K8I82_29050 [Anaerolineae bacterium]|nr:hypothetical protein [Anaerolineae bacterium]